MVESRIARLMLSRAKSTGPELMLKRSSTIGCACWDCAIRGMSQYIMIDSGHESVRGPDIRCSMLPRLRLKADDKPSASRALVALGWWNAH